MEAANLEPSGPRAGKKQWIGLAVIALPCLLYSMDLTVLNLAVPHLSAELRPSSTELLWIVDIYGFLIAPEQAGSASAVAETSTELGGALGIAVLGSMVGSIYRAAAARVVPAGVPHDAAEAARQTLGGAAAAARTLPDPIADQLLGASRAAYVQAFQGVAGTCVVIALAAALAAVLMRRDRPAGRRNEPVTSVECA